MDSYRPEYEKRLREAFDKLFEEEFEEATCYLGMPKLLDLPEGYGSYARPEPKLSPHFTTIAEFKQVKHWNVEKLMGWMRCPSFWVITSGIGKIVGVGTVLGGTMEDNCFRLYWANDKLHLGFYDDERVDPISITVLRANIVSVNKMMDKPPAYELGVGIYAMTHTPEKYVKIIIPNSEKLLGWRGHPHFNIKVDENGKIIHISYHEEYDTIHLFTRNNILEIGSYPAVISNEIIELLGASLGILKNIQKEYPKIKGALPHPIIEPEVPDPNAELDHKEQVQIMNANVKKLWGWTSQESDVWIIVHNSGKIVEMGEGVPRTRDNLILLGMYNGKLSLGFDTKTADPRIREKIRTCTNLAFDFKKSWDHSVIINFQIDEQGVPKDPEYGVVEPLDILKIIMPNISKLLGWMTSHSQFYIKTDDRGTIIAISESGYELLEKNTAMITMAYSGTLKSCVFRKMMHDRAFNMLQMSIRCANESYDKTCTFKKRDFFTFVEVPLRDPSHYPNNANESFHFDPHSHSESTHTQERPNLIANEMKKMFISEANMQRLNHTGGKPKHQEFKSELNDTTREEKSKESAEKHADNPNESAENEANVPNECCICFEKQRDCVILECFHMCTCYECGEKLKTCPICREGVTKIKRVYMS